MKFSATAVVLQSDSAILQQLINSLAGKFRSVQVVWSLAELRSSVAKNRASTAVIDINAVPISDVQQLCENFPGLWVVCNHRLADEEMWTAVLEAGAADLCASADSHAIMNAVARSRVAARSAAA